MRRPDGDFLASVARHGGLRRTRDSLSHSYSYSYSQCSSRSRSGSVDSSDDTDSDDFQTYVKRTGSSRSLELSRASSVVSDFLSDGDASELLDADELELLKAGGAASTLDDKERIRVTVRFRPLLAREKARRSAWVVQPETNTVSQDEDACSTSSQPRRRAAIYAFDEVYDAEHSTRAIYDGLARSIARSALDGIHGSIFAYGQTSSGKTHTMQGTSLAASARGLKASLAPSVCEEDAPEAEEDRRPAPGDGLVQLAVKDLFDEMARRADVEFLVRVSYLEVYNETVRDLLADCSTASPGGKTRPDATVHVREHPVTGVFTDNSERVVTDARGVLRALRDGERQRVVAATRMNERSSRSHSIFRVVVESKTRVEAAAPASQQGDGAQRIVEERVRVGCLNFVDLAGSESARATASAGDKRQGVESSNINRSLLALSKVVAALSSSKHGRSATNQKDHVNFRDSKLTRILQPSLSGAARVLFVCCASPAPAFVEDTRSTLKFATRAKRIKVNASVNEVVDQRARALMQLAQENQRLRQQLQALATVSRDQLDVMEDDTTCLRMRIASLEAAAVASAWSPSVVVAHAAKAQRQLRQPEVTGPEGEHSPQSEPHVLEAIDLSGSGDDSKCDKHESEDEDTDVESPYSSPMTAPSPLLVENAPCATCETLDDALESAKTRELESCLRIEQLEQQVAKLRRYQPRGDDGSDAEERAQVSSGPQCVLEVDDDSDETETLASSADDETARGTLASSLTTASVAVLGLTATALRRRSPVEALAIVASTLAMAVLLLVWLIWSMAAALS